MWELIWSENVITWCILIGLYLLGALAFAIVLGKLLNSNGDEEE